MQDIKYDYVDDFSETDKRIFTIHTEMKTYNARTIVLAVGPGNPPAILGMEYTQRVQGACRSLRFQRFPVQKKVDEKRPTNVMVIGDGLTLAQIGDLVIRRGVTKV